MAIINLLIEFPDGTSKEIQALPIDQVKFESEFEVSLSSLANNAKMTHLYWLAWHAEKRMKATDLDFDPWLETIAGIGATEAKK
jgi:hypothetical protein